MVLAVSLVLALLIPTLRSMVLLMVLFAHFEGIGCCEEDADLVVVVVVVVVAVISTERIPGEGRWGGRRGRERVERRRG